MTWAHLPDKSMDKNKLSFDAQLLEQIENNNNDRVKLTLKTAKDLHNAVDASGESLLHYAAKFGNEVVVSYLIELGAKINVENEDGDTPLLLATKGNHAETVQILLKSDANIDICNNNGESAVQIALHTSPIDVEIAKSFLKRVSNDCLSDATEIGERLMKIECPLYVAVLLENVDVTTCMISEGCAIAAKDPKSMKTALHIAVENVDSAHVQKLTFLGADVNAKDASGKTPLALLSDFSKPDEALSIVDNLLKARANLTPCDDDGFMQMRSVIQNGTKDVVKRVLESYGAAHSTKDQNERNIVHYLAKNPAVGKIISSRQFALGYFVVGYIDKNARDKDGLTALHCAMSFGNVGFVKYLISRGVNLHVLSNDGVSPLMQAVQPMTQSRIEERAECVKILLMNKAHPDVFMGNYFKKHHSESAIDRDYVLIEPAIAILAIWKAIEKPFNQGIWKKIQSYPKLERVTDVCAIELNKMRIKKAYGNMSVLDVLAEYGDEQCSRYSLFFALSGRLTKRLIRKYRSIPIYYEFLDNRVCKVMIKKEQDIFRLSLWVCMQLIIFLWILFFVIVVLYLVYLSFSR